jgi:hypothetical protein
VVVRIAFWNGIAGLALMIGACAGALGDTPALLAALFACAGAYWLKERAAGR